MCWTARDITGLLIKYVPSLDVPLHILGRLPIYTPHSIYTDGLSYHRNDNNPTPSFQCYRSNLFSHQTACQDACLYNSCYPTS
jgi:hypothetical protein